MFIIVNIVFTVVSIVLTVVSIVFSIFTMLSIVFTIVSIVLTIVSIFTIVSIVFTIVSIVYVYRRQSTHVSIIILHFEAVYAVDDILVTEHVLPPVAHAHARARAHAHEHLALRRDKKGATPVSSVKLSTRKDNTKIRQTAQQTDK